MTIGSMIRKVVEDFCQWLIAAQKESAAKVVDNVDWDQVDGLRQKLSSMRSKHRQSEAEPTDSSYMTDIYRENTELSGHLIIGGRRRDGGNTEQWSQGESTSFSPEFHQNLQNSIYNGATPVADDDWSLRQQQRSFNTPTADVYQPPLEPFVPEGAEGGYFSYATESSNAGLHQAQNAVPDESYEPLMIGGMDFSIAPQADMAELDGEYDSLPAVAAAPLVVQESPPPSSPFTVPAAATTHAPFAVPGVATAQAPSPVPQQIPPRAPFQLKPLALVLERALPKFGHFDASPNGDSSSGTQRTATLQIQNVVLRRDPPVAPDSPAAVQSVTQDLTDLVPIRYEASQSPDAASSEEARVVQQLFAANHQSLADVSFGGTP